VIDICVNLHNEQFSTDLAALLERAQDAGVVGILACATDLKIAQSNVHLCQQSLQKQHWPQLLSTAGVHPHDAQTWQDADSERLEKLCLNPFVRAVGECGLDFNRNFSDPAAQRYAFQAQIDLASQVKKPLFVHDRDSRGEVLRHLQRSPTLPPVVIHCFTGNAKELDDYLNAGFFIGITGWLCDAKRGQALRELVKLIPNDRLLVETDAPFLRPQNAPPNNQLFKDTGNDRKNSRRRNEPALLAYVLESLSEQRQQGIDALKSICADNARTLFGFD
jgi:TatD DNase family protein